MTQATFTAYARRIRELRRANPDVSEPALAPAFQDLVTALLPELAAVPPLVVVPEFQNPGAGRPDIALVTPGQPPRAFVELKAPAKPADPTRWTGAHDKRQFERLKELQRWGASNFVDFHLYDRDDWQGEATVVPGRALDPATAEAKADALVAAHDVAPFITLLTTLCRADAPTARDAPQLAGYLAHAARFIRSVVEERLGELTAQGTQAHALFDVRNTFRDVLYAHPEAGGYSSGDFDKLFAGAFAQTLAFGMLLVREATGQDVGDNAYQQMPAEHPLMRNALEVLTLAQVRAEVGIGFDIMRDTVNSFAPAILAVQPNGRDPILYFYEDFLATFDPAARERYGVYYTPVEVVRYMTGALDRALRERLGTQGLRDPGVTILDPATGTGTFLLGVAERVREQVEADGGGVEAAMALNDLAGRMYGFELLVGPYAVAHYRLHHALTRAPLDPATGEPVADWVPPQLPRLGVYLTDTLAAPNAAAPAGPLGFVAAGIADERREANRIKTEQPILAIIGNPPYRRLAEGENETLVGRWMDGVWDDLKAPVRAAGKGNQLNTFPELSVAFWRWALWKLFEADNAPRRGVVAFITNRKFLTGWPYAGLRKMLRERFDRIEIVDLRGDNRAGVRGDVETDVNVFNIQVGVSIAIAVADGSKAEGALANVTYTDAWAHDLFARRAKLDWLNVNATEGRIHEHLLVERAALDDMRPAPFSNGEWVCLPQLFAFWKSGMKSGDDGTFVSVAKEALAQQVAPVLQMRDDPAHLIALEQRLSYRPLDRRWYYADLALLQRPGPAMHRAWGPNNRALYTMPGGVGAGPAVWAQSTIPDYHAFRGSYGGYAFPLYDRRQGPDATNLSSTLLAHLGEAYGAPVTAEDAFDTILALLSATSYTRRFAEDLEDTFPHIPFPASRAVFDRAVAVGREIRAVETFAREPLPQFRPGTLARIVSQPTGEVRGGLTAEAAWNEGEVTLCADGSGRLSGIPRAAWDFAVSGYRVLPRWIDGRKGQPADLALIREFRDVAARIGELIHRFDEADLVLADTLADTLTRAELGFGDAPAEGAAKSDD